MKSKLKSPLILIILFILFPFSCAVSKEKEPLKQAPSSSIMLSPIAKLSLELANTMGFKLDEREGAVSVTSLQPFGPGAVAGLADGMNVKTLGGVSLKKMSEDDLSKLIPMLTAGELIAVASDKDGSEREIRMHVGPDNCPQSIVDYITFVETPRSGQKSTFLMIKVRRFIRTSTFERRADNTIALFNRKTGKWWTFEKYDMVFDNKADPSNLPSVLSKEFKYNSEPQMKNETISFSGDVVFDLSYKSSEIRNDPDRVMSGSGKLRIGDTQYDGFVMSRQVNEKFIRPFRHEPTIQLRHLFPRDSRHVEDKVADWIILFDSSGTSFELSAEGDAKSWWSVIYSAAQQVSSSCLTSKNRNPVLSSMNMSWFDDVIVGKEADPYPSEISIKAPENFPNDINLKGEFPSYYEDNDKILIILTGECKSADGATIPIAGFMQRLIYS